MTHFKHAFISYGRRESLLFVGRLHQKFRLAGYDVWFDKVNIPHAEAYDQRINNGIENAQNFMYVMAPRCLTSPYCLIELEYARVLGKRIIPVNQMVIFDTPAKELSESDKNVMRKFYEKHHIKGVEIHTEADVLKRSLALIGTSDWLPAQEILTEDDLRKIANFQKSHEDSWKFHDDLGYLQVYQFEKIGTPKDDVDIAFQKITDIFKRHQDYNLQHTQILAQALIWNNNSRKTQFLLVGEERKKAEKWLLYRFPYGEQPPCKPNLLQIEFLSDSRKNAENLTTDVFICYTLADKAVMETVNHLLMRNGFTTWLHSYDIKKGDDFGLEVRKGIEDASNFLFFMSKDSFASKWCMRELRYAISLHKRIITLKIGNFEAKEIPEEIDEIQYIDFSDNTTEDDFRRDIDEITKKLSENEDYHRSHKMFLSQAIRWEQQHHKPSLLLRGYNLENANTWLRLHLDRILHPPTDLHKRFILESNAKKGQLETEVFISYSRKDADFARKLNRTLQEAGKTTWFDQESISEGVDFDTEIFKGISQSHNFLFIISPDSLASKFCDDEIRFAVEQGKRFIPVLWRETPDAYPVIAEISEEYAKINWIFFNNPSTFNEKLIALIQAIDLDLDYVQAHTKWQMRAHEWFRSKNEHEKGDLLLNKTACEKAEQWLEDYENAYKKPEPAPTDLQRSFIQESRKAIQETVEKIERERQEALLNLQKANNFIGLFYFYEDKVALAFKHEKFFFIDKNGDIIEALGEWDKADHFTDAGNGFTRVWKNNEECWLDTEGNRYPVAYYLRHLNEEIKALDLRGTQLYRFPKIFDHYQLEVLILNGTEGTWGAGINNLSPIPKHISKLSNLKVLHMEWCRLDSFPPDTKHLTNLQDLNVKHNRFTSFPKELTMLPNLKKLDISINSLSSLLPAIRNLKNLVRFNANFNAISKLPKEIGELKNLKRLHLEGNRLSQLPQEIGNLHQLTHLMLKDNQISELPAEIGNLNHLVRLDLTGNQLFTLPAELINLKNIHSILLAGNPLVYIPKSLGHFLEGKTDITPEELDLLLHPEKRETLNLENKSLTHLPLEVAKLVNLQLIQLSGNPLIALSPDLEPFLRGKTDLNEQELNLLFQPEKRKELDLSNQKFVWLPPQISTLKNLKTLFLNGNGTLHWEQAVSVLSVMSQRVFFTLDTPTPQKNTLGVRIDTAQLFEVLSYAKPEQMSELKTITELDLSGSPLKTLSPMINQLTNLRKLKFMWSNLSVLPAEIGELEHLEELNFTWSDLGTLPPEIEQLKNLKRLYLTSSLIPLKKLNKILPLLPSLEELELDDMGLTKLPESVLEIKNLRVLGLGNRYAMRKNPNNFKGEEQMRIMNLLPNCQISFWG